MVLRVSLITAATVYMLSFDCHATYHVYVQAFTTNSTYYWRYLINTYILYIQAQ